MWIITVRGPASDPREIVMPAGKFSIGRRAANDLVVPDESASLDHAQLELEPLTHTLTLRDLASTHGTFVNHEQITLTRILESGDQIRIGQYLIRVVYQIAGHADAQGRVAVIQPITRNLLLESLDQHALLVFEVSERLNLVTDQTLALEAVSNAISTALGADYCRLIPAEQFSHFAELRLPNSPAQRSIADKAVVAIPDITAWPDFEFSQRAPLSDIRSLICVPVMVGQEVAALIDVRLTAHRNRQLSQADVRLAVALGHLAALTIQRMRLLQRVDAFRDSASTDELTQLYSRRRFLELAEQEVARARRFLRPIAAILLDIDNFHELNDAHGTAVGDEILRAVAARCRLTLRQADLVGRFTPDAMAILGIETNIQAARLIADRLRRHLASSPIYTEPGLVHITISAGITALGDRNVNLTTLLNEAGAALDTAKRGGGNRVEVAGGDGATSQPTPQS